MAVFPARKDAPPAPEANPVVRFLAAGIKSMPALYPSFVQSSSKRLFHDEKARDTTVLNEPAFHNGTSIAFFAGYKRAYIIAMPRDQQTDDESCALRLPSGL